MFIVRLFDNSFLEKFIYFFMHNQLFVRVKYTRSCRDLCRLTILCKFEKYTFHKLNDRKVIRGFAPAVHSLCKLSCPKDSLVFNYSLDLVIIRITRTTVVQAYLIQWLVILWFIDYLVVLSFFPFIGRERLFDKKLLLSLQRALKQAQGAKRRFWFAE